ncbi:uncharacterized protein LOC113233720, partial [Hyposmocoma kahamanoa]|uniref:uncharacterized protein LOC113233720 n=1 Tax=Hyposmocoma kahamanoa TaxID=1477025 RepID=UPI000E6D94B2
MQAQYPKKYSTINWDPLNLEYPVRKFPDTGCSSETIGHGWKRPPEILKSLKDPLTAIKEYFRDYNVTKDLSRSQTTLDFGYKQSETKRHNKHNSCTENHYIYPPLRKLADRPPQCTAHGTTEMKSAYTVPTTPARLVTDKDQYKHPASLPHDPPAIEPRFHKELEPIDTTHEGFEKLLDPYLTTSRLHHRPYTADQLARPSVTNDVVTYYTYADVPRIRRPKPKIEEWRIPHSISKPVYDREKFQHGFREIRTHKKLKCVP